MEEIFTTADSKTLYQTVSFGILFINMVLKILSNTSEQVQDVYFFKILERQLFSLTDKLAHTKSKTIWSSWRNFKAFQGQEQKIKAILFVCNSSSISRWVSWWTKIWGKKISLTFEKMYYRIIKKGQLILNESQIKTSGHLSIKLHDLYFSPGWCGSVDWGPACELKGHWFNSNWPKPQVQARAPTGGRQEATHQCLSHINVSLPLILPLFPSL